MGFDVSIGPVSESDRRILQMVKELSVQLGIPNYSPNGVLWTNLLPMGFGFLPHAECRFSRWKVLLPETLEAKLEPEEWRPLLASGLILWKKLRWRRLGIAVIGSLPALGFLAVVTSLLWFLRGYWGSQSGDPTSAFLSLLFFLSIAWFWNVIALYRQRVEPQLVPLPMYLRFLRRARLEADRKSAELVGKSVLLGVLTKVQEMYPSDVQLKAGKAFSSMYSGIPSIQERIRNLEGLSKSP